LYFTFLDFLDFTFLKGSFFVSESIVCDSKSRLCDSKFISESRFSSLDDSKSSSGELVLSHFSSIKDSFFVSKS